MTGSNMETMMGGGCDEYDDDGGGGDECTRQKAQCTGTQ